MLSSLFNKNKNGNADSTVSKMNNRGLSDVVGVILLVAIAVGLAAAVGGYVFVFQDDLGENAPTAEIDYDVDQSAGEVEVRFGSGDSLEPGDQYAIQIDGDDTVTEPLDDDFTGGGILEEEINDLNPVIGEFDIEEDAPDDDEVEAGEELQLIWVSDDGEDTEEVGESFTVPDIGLDNE